MPYGSYPLSLSRSDPVLPPVLHPPMALAPDLAPAPAVNTYRAYQTTEGYVTLTDTMADVIRFSGIPDAIEVFVRDFPAVIEFDDEQNRPTHTIRLETGIFYDPAIRVYKVRAQNATPGSNAQIQVVGKWR